MGCAFGICLLICLLLGGPKSLKGDMAPPSKLLGGPKSLKGDMAPPSKLLGGPKSLKGDLAPPSKRTSKMPLTMPMPGVITSLF